MIPASLISSKIIQKILDKKDINVRMVFLLKIIFSWKLTSNGVICSLGGNWQKSWLKSELRCHISKQHYCYTLFSITNKMFMFKKYIVQYTYCNNNNNNI